MIGIVIGALVVFGIGHISGQYHQSRYMKKRLFKALPLLQRSLIDISVKAIDLGLTKEQTLNALETDFKFVDIIMGEK